MISVLEERGFHIKLPCSFDTFPGVVLYAVRLLMRLLLNPEFLHCLLIAERNGAAGTQIWCFFSLICSIMVMIGRVPLRTVLFFDRVPALGSPFFRFLDSPDIIVEVLGCGSS